MEQTNLPSVHLKDFEPISPDVLSVFPEGLVKKNMIIPLAKRDGRVVAAVPRTSGLVKPEGLKLLAGCPVDLVLAPTEEIIAFIKTYYSSSASDAPSRIETPAPAAVTIIPGPTTTHAPSNSDHPALFIRLVSEVAQNHASEGLFDLKGENVRVRHRIRGVMAKPPSGTTWSQSDFLQVVSLIRERGENHSVEGVKWSELQANVPVGNDSYDCEFNLSETSNLVLLSVKVNPHQEQRFDLLGWGLDPLQAKTVDELLAREQGVILFCGAEQDGVQSTLNACIKKLSLPSKHVICVESHVDQWVQDANQFNAKGDAKLFTQYLQTALSYSPDVLKVRPLESKESWEMCLRESLRGPLILGSAFARDAAEALANIVRGGSDAALISSGLLAIVVQRKLRLNCQHCQQKETVQRDRLREIGIPIELQPAAFYYGAGCERCYKTGFGNETHIFEILALNDEVKNILHRDVSAEKIRAVAKTSGMLTLRQVAVHKAIAGQTSLAEVVRVSPK